MDQLIKEIVDSLKEEKNKAIDEAVKAAVIPLQADNYSLNLQVEDLKGENSSLKNKNFWDAIIIGVSCLAVGIGVGGLCITFNGG